MVQQSLQTTGCHPHDSNTLPLHWPPVVWWHICSEAYEQGEWPIVFWWLRLIGSTEMGQAWHPAHNVMEAIPGNYLLHYCICFYMSSEIVYVKDVKIEQYEAWVHGGGRKTREIGTNIPHIPHLRGLVIMATWVQAPFLPSMECLSHWCWIHLAPDHHLL